MEHNITQQIKGRILVLWDNNVWSETLIDKKEQQLTTLFKNVGGLKIYINFVYGKNLASERKELWQ